MSLVIPIVLLCFVFMVIGLHLPRAFLFFCFLLAAPWVVVVCLIRLAQWVSGGRSTETDGRHGVAGPAPDAGQTRETLTCPDPHCGRVNDGRARFCAQCGRPLL